MPTEVDKFIDFIETRKKQLENVVETYRRLKQALAEVPDEVAQQAMQMLVAEARGAAPETRQDEPSTAISLAGVPAHRCAEIILRENGNVQMHFNTIAKESLRRGYEGRATGDQDEIESTTAKSFWAAMSRSDALEATGKGFYRLREPNLLRPRDVFEDELEGDVIPVTQPDSEEDASLGAHSMTQADAAFQILFNSTRALRIQEILEGVSKKGYLSVPAGKLARRNFSNSVWAAMSRDDRFIKVGRGLWGLVVWNKEEEQQWEDRP